MVRGEVVVLNSTKNAETWMDRLLNPRSYRLRSYTVHAQAQPEEGMEFFQMQAKAFIIADPCLQRWTEPLVKRDIAPILWVAERLDQQMLTSALRLGVRGVLDTERDPLWSEFTLESVIKSWEQERLQRERAEKALRDLSNRKGIERAKGIMMRRYGISEDDAYKRIRSEAMSARKSMIEVAESILLFDKWAGTREG